MMSGDESLQLRVLPPDFDGPVCVECKFASRQLQYCYATEAKVIRPAQKNPVTGEVSDAWLTWTACRLRLSLRFGDGSQEKSRRSF
jgi:hypothetical protein